MSIERKLLNLCAVTLYHRDICPDLLKEIQELLAQPEPTAEPVAWMCNLLGNVITYKPADNNGYTPLYKSPQKRKKRKSLSGRESEALWEAAFKSAISYLVFDEICVAIGVDDE